MMRKVVLALLAAASLSFAVVDTASARGIGGGMHGGGMHGGGGMRGGNFGGFRGGGLGGYRGGYGRGIGALGLGLGLGYYGSSYAYYPGGYGYYDNPYYYGAGYGGCYLVRRQVWTPYGPRVRRVRVCD